MGPKRVHKVLSNWEFEIEDLITKKIERIHASHLKFFSERDLEITEEMRNQIAHNEDTFEINEIQDIRYKKDYDQYQLFINWKGFSEEENTWEFLEDLWEMSREYIKRYLEHRDMKSAIKKDAKNWLKAAKLA
jgi:Chromo (CHRromatin Organisation MOdifier) domain